MYNLYINWIVCNVKYVIMWTAHVLSLRIDYSLKEYVMNVFVDLSIVCVHYLP